MIGGIGSQRGMPAGFDPQAMKAKMQQGMESLKSTNPDLAAKFEKVGARMEELQNSGTDMKSAMQTIQKEFGQPSKAEMGEFAGAMGIDLNQMGSMNMQNGDISAMLDQMNAGQAGGVAGTESAENDMMKDLLKLFDKSENEDKSKSTDSLKQNIQAMIQKYTSSASQGTQGSYFGSQGFAA